MTPHTLTGQLFCAGRCLPTGWPAAQLVRDHIPGQAAAQQRASQRLRAVATGPDVPPEWQPPRPNTSPSPAPPEFEPPREPGAIPGPVPEYTPPQPPSTPGPTPLNPPGRPLRPDETPQIPDPDQDDPIRNPDKRREQTNNPDGTPEPEQQPANPPGRPLRPVDLGGCIGDWNAVYGRQGGRITFLPADSTRAAAVQLRLEGGVQAIISLLGANVVSWVGSQWRELLHRGPQRTESGDNALHGGIEVAFPRCTHKQTRDEQGRDAFPLMPDEGLLSQCCFRPVHSAARSGWTSVSLKAQSDEATLAMWPHAFEVLVTISLRDSPEHGLDPGCALRYVLQIYNPDAEEFSFNAEIKPHVKIESVKSTYLFGFEGSQVITHDRRGQARTFAAVRGFPLTGEITGVLGSGLHGDGAGSHEDTVNMLCFNMQRKAIQVESGAKDTAVQARTRQGLRDMGIHHPINTQGHPVSFARDFVMLTGTTAQEPIRLKVGHKWAGEIELRETMRTYEPEDGQEGGYDFEEPSWKHPNAQQRDGSAAAAALDDDGDEERRAFAESFYNPDTSDDYVSTPDDQAGGGDDNAIDRLAGEY